MMYTEKSWNKKEMNKMVNHTPRKRTLENIYAKLNDRNMCSKIVPDHVVLKLEYGLGTWQVWSLLSVDYYSDALLVPDGVD